MARDEFEGLRNPGDWDHEQAETRPGMKSPRAVVSVAFSRDDFNTVAQHARQAGLKTSEFIRSAALEQTQRRGATFTVHMSTDERGLIRSDYTGAAPAKQLDKDEEKAVTW